jgi:hypothetical protein
MSRRSDKRGDDHTRSPRNGGPPIVQETVNQRPTCGLCHDNELSVEHGQDWDFWLMIGPDQAALTHAMRYFAMYIVWQSVYYSSAGASIPICYDCRLSTYRQMKCIANLEIQSDCFLNNPQLIDLGHASYEMFIAYKTIAKQIANQLYFKIIRIEDNRVANSRRSRGSSQW